MSNLKMQTFAFSAKFGRIGFPNQPRFTTQESLIVSLLGIYSLTGVECVWWILLIRSCTTRFPMSSAGMDMEVSMGSRYRISSISLIPITEMSSGMNLWNSFKAFKTPKYEDQVSYPLTLGEDQVFILCDFREGAKDSRYFGAVSQSEIKGKVLAVLRRSSL